MDSADSENDPLALDEEAFRAGTGAYFATLSSLAMILLTFFIYQNSTRTMSARRSTELRQSLTETFAIEPHEQAAAPVIKDRSAALYELGLISESVQKQKLSSGSITTQDDSIVVSIPVAALFHAGDDQLSPILLNELTQIATTIGTRNVGLTFQLCLADSSDDALLLGLRRAGAISRLLVEKGICESAFNTRVGQGECQASGNEEALFRVGPRETAQTRGTTK